MNIKRINASIEEFNDQYVLVKMAMLMQDGEEASVERLFRRKMYVRFRLRLCRICWHT